MIVVIVILVTAAIAIILLYLMYKKCNGVFMKYFCCCGCAANQDEVLSLQQENQRLRHELSQHKLQLSASPSHNELIRGKLTYHGDNTELSSHRLVKARTVV